MARGAIPVEETVELAVQLTEGLEGRAVSGEDDLGALGQLEEVARRDDGLDLGQQRQQLLPPTV